MLERLRGTGDGPDFIKLTSKTVRYRAEDLEAFVIGNGTAQHRAMTVVVEGHGGLTPSGPPPPDRCDRSAPTRGATATAMPAPKGGPRRIWSIGNE